MSSSQSKRVRIVGDHPHRGETGTVLDHRPMRFGMWEVKLDYRGPGAEGCFAAPEDLRPLPVDEDGYR